MFEDPAARERRYQLWGWVLFIVCAGFFIVSSIRNSDMFSLVASVIFLFACVIFMIPLVSKRFPRNE